MKIISHDEFVKLPSGILYSEYTQCIFGELKIKYESISDSDWFYSNLEGNPDYYNGFSESIQFVDACAIMENGNDLAPDLNTLERDGMFDHDRLFCVYNHKDIMMIIDKLQSITIFKPE